MSLQCQYAVIRVPFLFPSLLLLLAKYCLNYLVVVEQFLSN